MITLPTSQLLRLKTATLFSKIPEAALLSILSKGRVRKVPRNQHLFWEGDPGSTMFVILDGQVAIERMTESGDTVALAIRGEGEVVGELALFNIQSRSADARTTVDSELLVLDGETLMSQVKDSPELAIGMIEVLAEKLRESIQSRTNLRRKVSERLAIAIVHEFSAHGKKGTDGRWELEHRVTQGEWANRIGATREHVNKALKELQGHGCIEIEGGNVIVIDRTILKKLAKNDDR